MKRRMGCELGSVIREEESEEKEDQCIVIEVRRQCKQREDSTEDRQLKKRFE